MRKLQFLKSSQLSQKLNLFLDFIKYTLFRTTLVVIILLLLGEIAKGQSLNMNRNTVEVEVIEVDSLEDTFLEETPLQNDSVIIKDQLLIPDSINVVNEDVFIAPKVNSPANLHLSEYAWEDKVKPVKVEQNAFNINVDMLSPSSIKLSDLDEKGINFDDGLLTEVMLDKVPKARVDEFLRVIIPLAKKQQTVDGIPWHFRTLQMALESGWGTSILSQPKGKAFKDRRKKCLGTIRAGAYNFGGLKCKYGHKCQLNHGCVEMWDDNIRDRFLSFNSIEDFMKGHGEFLIKNGYKKTALALAKKYGKSETNFFIWVEAMQIKGYSTSGDYKRILIKMNERYQLYRTK